MANIQPISRERHAGKRWQRYSSYGFARTHAAVPLTVAEFSRAAVALPIALLPQGDGFLPFALLGLEQGKNLCVAPDGRWIGEYIPAVLRAHPFALASTEAGEKVLCVDEDSGLVTENPGDELFFAEDGEPSQATGVVLKFLYQLDLTTAPTKAACDVLQKHGLIVPWPITLQSENGQRKLDGIFQIDEGRMSSLPDEAFVELRQNGALQFAYCQLLSMQHLQSLGTLAQAHAAAEAQNPLASLGGSGELDLEFLKKNETLNFGGFR